ncbi:lectin C-type domain protein [Teladorsagia circumcincta]|uniref:Lectin C-type domain protein n=1 Tax=Teladorsagia circumcincta TaxID=45464 RepID=A0A2G9UL14_TELCI|nr:lectin C-type domain protein [Teladorsagia circumcincta]
MLQDLANIQNDYHSTRAATWIGLYRDPKNANNWLWKSGETCGYRNWNQPTSEPNNARGDEDNVQIYSDRDLLTWNDAADIYDSHYICERKLCPLDKM